MKSAYGMAEKIFNQLGFRLIKARHIEDADFLYGRILHSLPDAIDFDFEKMKKKTLSFVESTKAGDEAGMYRYSLSSGVPNLYASAYACMTISLYDGMSNVDKDRKEGWIRYFDSMQSEEDGLFYDPSIASESFQDTDWWGARHLALHMIAAYAALSTRPRHDFKFLDSLYDKSEFQKWAASLDISGYLTSDVDNKIMNYGALMQYSRDFFNNVNAGETLKLLKAWLVEKINPDTGIWGNRAGSSWELSRTVQFNYHILPIFLYDGEVPIGREKIIDAALETQNRIGGYGVAINSSACEDIDSIEPLARLSAGSDHRAGDVRRSLLAALPWVLSNMNDDGGFVFRRNEPFRYGHQEMSSGKNESSLFATWFRTLSLAYLAGGLGLKNGYKINRTPGLEF